MLKLSWSLPKQVNLAVSGGVDSVVALDFLAKKHAVTILHINHNEGNSDASQELVEQLAQKYNCAMLTKRITATKPKSESPEEFWRKQRYEFFDWFSKPIITAHTLDDCVETWVWSSLHGHSKLIPNARKNVYRPFLQTTKAEFISWSKRKHLTYIEDQSNADENLMRSYMRKHLLPHALKINPGLYKTILKKVKQQQCPTMF